MSITSIWLAQQRALELKLKRLEKSYDADTKHLRQAQDDIADINLLFKERKIDADHRDYLIARVQATYQEREKQRQIKRLKQNERNIYNPDMSRPWYKRWFALW